MIVYHSGVTNEMRDIRNLLGNKRERVNVMMSFGSQQERTKRLTRMIAKGRR